jgi:methionyl-tRNA formyltransferase
MKIIFMGTSNFSKPALEKLLLSEHKIVGVFTKKPTRANRGQKISFSPIYEMAQKNGLEIFTPRTFKNGKNMELLTKLKADLIVVVAYGLILTKEVFNSVKYGAINIHPSLLPRWRGSAPMERTLLSDDKETGVCIMQVDEGIDSGDVIKCEKIALTDEIDLDFLSNYLANRGAELLLEVIDNIQKNGKIIGAKQNDALVTFAEKITNDDAVINWETDSVRKIHKKIKTLGGSIGIFIDNGGNRIKILKADFELKSCKNSDKIGSIIDKKNFYIQCIDGILKPLIVQREGKKAVGIRDFVNGYRIVEDSVKGTLPTAF